MKILLIYFSVSAPGLTAGIYPPFLFKFLLKFQLYLTNSLRCLHDKKKRIYDIDLVITTHDDSDHSGALIDLQNNFMVKKYVNNGGDFPIKIGDVVIENYNNHIGEQDDENFSSLVLGFKLLNKSFLVTGDAPIEIEKYMFARQFFFINNFESTRESNLKYVREYLAPPAWLVGYYIPINSPKTINVGAASYPLFGTYDDEEEFYSAIGGEVQKVFLNMESNKLNVNLDPSLVVNDSAELNLINGEVNLGWLVYSSKMVITGVPTGNNRKSALISINNFLNSSKFNVLVFLLLTLSLRIL